MATFVQFASATTWHNITLTGVSEGAALFFIGTATGGPGSVSSLTAGGVAPSGSQYVSADNTGGTMFAWWNSVSAGDYAVAVTSSGHTRTDGVLFEVSGWLGTETTAEDFSAGASGSASNNHDAGSVTLPGAGIVLAGGTYDAGAGDTPWADLLNVGGGSRETIGYGIFAEAAVVSGAWTTQSAVTSRSAILAILEAVAPESPQITDVDTDETVTSDQTGVSVTGTNLGTTNANRTFELVQGSVEVAQTETGTGDDTSATLSIVTEPGGAAIKFGTADLKVTRDDDATADIEITVNPPTGQIYVDVGTPDTESDNRITASPDIASGDQLHARGVGGGAAPTGLTLNADATFEFSSGNTPTSFDVRVWDSSDATWGAWATQTVGAVELVAADSSHAHTADNADLAQGYILTAAGADHAHSVESPSLIQASTLTAADSSHAHTAESPSLTQAHQLAAQGASHAHTVDEPTLVQSGALAVQGASHAHTVDSVALTQAHALEAENASHGHTVDSATLSQSVALVAEGAAHGHTVESPALVQAHVLVAADAAHAHTAESVELGFGTVLEPADARHAHTADAATLTQASTLAVEGAHHAHTADQVTLSESVALTVADVFHGHTADAVVLSTADRLSAEGVTHAHTVDSPSLTQANVLTVEDAMHAHLADLVRFLISTSPQISLTGVFNPTKPLSGHWS